ncbi:MAG: hypothetical protein D3913_04145 [Candidatus Electrothrix sp. LOE1_4_5]|nr:hypothetical protein [Candidatus Electrothrix gigas]
MIRITILSIVLLAGLSVLPALAQDDNCYKPDIGREEMVKCLEAKHEQSKKEIEALREELTALKAITEQLQRQITEARNNADAADRKAVFAQQSADRISERIIPICHYDSPGPNARTVGGRQWTHPCSDENLTKNHGYTKEGPYFYGLK